MLDKARSTACYRNQHIVGGRGGLLIYVRMNINMISQSLSGVCRKQSLPGPALESGRSHILEQSLFRSKPKAHNQETRGRILKASGSFGVGGQGGGDHI